MVPTWGPSGADRTQLGPMLAPWTLLSGCSWYKLKGFSHICGILAKLPTDDSLSLRWVFLLINQMQGMLTNRPLLTVESQTPGHSYIDFIPGLPNKNTILIIASHFVQLFSTLFSVYITFINSCQYSKPIKHRSLNQYITADRSFCIIISQVLKNHIRNWHHPSSCIP